jgi:hypothetical protein
MSGTFGNFGESGAPGFVDPFAFNAVGLGGGQAIQAMQNRYNQLGMGNSTPEAMDLGQLPSISGGLPAQIASTVGELQNSALQPMGQQNLASQAGTILHAFSK